MIDEAGVDSTVTFEIEPYGDNVKLTVTHEGLDESTYFEVGNGWSPILSSLKTLLETGDPMPFTGWNA